MDKISVNDASLQNCYTVLKELNKNSETVTQKCIDELNAELSGVDDSLKKEIQAYIQMITELKENLRYCIEENLVAISDRYGKIPIYEQQSYKKQNIV